MQKVDYTCKFTYIAQEIRRGKLTFVDHNAVGGAKETQLKVAANDANFKKTVLKQVTELNADLIDIAAAVHTTDRLCGTERKRTCQIHVELPIRNVALCANVAARKELEDILYWFTEDHWSFTFIKYSKDGHTAELQRALEDGEAHDPRKVALWSGGLDALAGLYNHLSQDTTMPYTLLGVGTNTIVPKLQKNVRDKLPKEFVQRVNLVQIPLYHLKKGVQTSSDARSRGFVFLLLGAVCALQESQDKLYIYENGIGAMNLPLRDCEVGLDHARSMHPLSLLRMGTWLSSIREKTFTFENPYLFETKAQVCEKVLAEKDIVFSTSSCDRRPRAKPMLDCGCCTACLLRRQAIAALGKTDETSYNFERLLRQQKRSDVCQKEDCAKELLDKKYRRHLVATVAHVATLKRLLSSEEDAWERMVEQYPILEETVQKIASEKACQEKMRTGFLKLYRTYVDEWNDDVRSILYAGLLS